MADKLIVWAAALLTPENIQSLLGVTFLVLWLWSEKLSYNSKVPANGVMQRFAPLVKALGEKMAPPTVVKVMESLDKKCPDEVEAPAETVTDTINTVTEQK